MQHSFSDFGTTREMRLMRMSPATPESVPPQEQPQDGDRRFDIPTNQLPPETLRALEEHISQLRNQTNETVESEIARIQATAQRDVDALAATPGASRQFITEYIRSANANLNGRGLRMSMINGQIQISPFRPTVRSPEAEARKNRIVELQRQISEVDRNISLLMRDFRQNAVQYRGQKGAAMNRYNIAPEINRFLMQFPQASMQASANPLNQLYALKFKLQQELAGVKSGVIKVPVPGEGGQDPSLIGDPRFAAGNLENGRFNLNGAPGGLEGFVQSPEEAAALEAKILRMTDRWRNSRTEEERETVEGFLMMDGVDVDASDLQKDQIVMVNPEEKGMQFLVGLIVVMKSLLDRLSRKRTEIEGAQIPEKDPSEMTEEERTKEKEGNDAKITELKDKRKKTQAEMKKVKEKLDDKASPPEGEAKEKLERELKDMKEELTKIEEEIEKLEERNAALLDPESAKEKAGKDEERGIVGQDQLQDDPVFRDFQSAKQEMRAKLRSSIDQFLTGGDIQKGMERLGTILGVDFSKVDWQTAAVNMAKEFTTFMEALLDHFGLEKNTSGKYRIALDMNAAATDAKQSALFRDLSFDQGDIEKLVKQLNDANGGMQLSISGSKIVSAFMTGEEIMKTAF